MLRFVQRTSSSFLVGFFLVACGEPQARQQDSSEGEVPDSPQPSRDVSRTSAESPVQLPEPAEGRVRLARAFLPEPQVGEGVAGGSLPVEVLLGELGVTGPEGLCVGWVSSAPDYWVELGEPFPELRVVAYAEEDVALVVVAPNGAVHCSDDAYGTQPALTLRNAPTGAYGVWLATREQGLNPMCRLGLSELVSTNPEDIRRATPTFAGLSDGAVFVP